jgi:hypothetical protein
LGFLESSIRKQQLNEQHEHQQHQQQILPAARFRLLVGTRHPNETLYQDRFQALQDTLKDNLSLRYAFSRLPDRPKEYVQDILKQPDESLRVWKMMIREDDAGQIYVCGRMEICTSVVDSLLRIAETVGGLEADDAASTIQQWQHDGRILTDCWSVEDPPTTNSTASNDSLLPPVPEPLTTPYSIITERDDLQDVPSWPRYLRLFASGEYDRRIRLAEEMFTSCVSCGRFCNVDRISDDPKDWGECRVGSQAIVSAVDAHFGEESCLKGTRGSGTIFFGACNLKCMYCQNWQVRVYG